ncbi:hypothetical protein L593_08845 [Salinarchaeum sp. Harcht-Bsk1]|uniref:hypothetical protein n=1 Tax=Salinarchaeum sp. Harcht-Bsk1 TaxID=1333523 RepID=UPI0003422F21|nr:hypothetical protein [Salinarchaeum sp. Harcht-Bsk1]AGN01714.1 hypothetical protein L593_08845 [Salinarchaeum sp. Harcht-Bsk1]
MTDGESWESERLETVYAETRAVIEAQQATLSDIDAKAMKTVRFNAILIGILLTAFRFAGARVFDATLLHVALGSLLVPTVVGIVTYNESRLYVGGDGEYLEWIGLDRTGGRRWDEDVIVTYTGLISENAETIDWNAWLLTVTQGMLVVGIVAAVLATGL